ncbi:MAG: hypothetical protein EBS13_08610, partial [Verrucomicrobia bacterium]|nr:hypothetical protein [Verrucomicrobiota bacterium]
MKVSLAQILLNTLFIFVFLGCVNRQEPHSKVKQEVPPVLVESEMLAKVNECRVCHGTQEAQRGPILDGMEYWYLYEQLQKFHSGVRG